MMGILGAYIGGIYEEVKGRPHYIIDETVNVSYE
jgi:dolichol-phosphate mannosyltransferase